MRLSVIVCTRNRAYAIGPCLDSIAASLARAAPVEAEIVVVDNGSTDNTSAVLRAWAEKSAFPVNLQYEPEKGIAAARNGALRAAKGDLLVWTDDDCRLDLDHIGAALRHDDADTELVLRGGRIELGDPTDLPLTIKTDRAPARWSRRMNSAKHQNLSQCILGCNMTMRRALANRLGPFDRRFGSKGIPAGEDTDYVFRAYIAGIPIDYAPDMVVFHCHGRKSNAEGNRMMHGYITGMGAIYAKHFFRHPTICRTAYWDLKLAVREAIAGRNNFMPHIGFSYKNMVACWALGAARYVAASIRMPKGRSR